MASGVRRAVVMVVLAGLSLVGGAGGAPAGAAAGSRATAGASTGRQAPGITDAGDLASASEAELLELIEAADARRREIESAAAGVDDEVGDLESRLNAAENHLGALQARQWTLGHKLDAANRQLDDARVHRQRLALDAYTGRSSALGYASSLLYANDLGALAARRSYVDFLGESQADTLAREEALRDEVADLLEEIDGVRREVRRKQAGADADAARVEEGRRVSVGLLADAEAEVAERDRLYHEAHARKVEFDTELADLAAQSEVVSQTLRARRGLDVAGDSEAAAARSGGQLADPLPGHPFGSPFGPRVHPVFGTVRMHTGVDIGAGSGEPIHSADDGVVVSAGWLGGYGNATIVDHGGGLATLYGHQSEVLVSAGERVGRGQVIGRIGCTGTCTGPHLHFEVRIDGDPVNPVPYLT